MDLVFATGNLNKLREVKQLLSHTPFNIIGLKDIGFTEDIPEPYDNLTDNALIKARTIHQRFGVHCFSEDTGLEVQALDGAPGVYSARYAGDNKSSDDNMNLLLQNMQGKTNRQAAFRTVFALILNDQEYTFEGIASGQILMARKGIGGFGYDPIFQPDGYAQTFAEMDSVLKNEISHRGKGVRKLVAFLNNYEL